MDDTSIIKTRTEKKDDFTVGKMKIEFTQAAFSKWKAISTDQKK